MPVKWTDGDLSFGLTWFRRRVFVSQKSTGQTVYPPPQNLDRLVQMFQLIDALALTQLEREIVLAMAAKHFARACLRPKSLDALMFHSGDPKEFVDIQVAAVRSAIPAM